MVIIEINPEKSSLNLTRIIWAQLKQFVPVQNNLHCPKYFWTYRRKGHKKVADSKLQFFTEWKPYCF